MRSILSIVAGVIVGVFGMYLIEMINLSIYPLPSDLNTDSEIEYSNYLKNLPYTAFGLILLAHTMGALIASFIAGMVAKKKRVRMGLTAGIILIVFTIYTAYSPSLPLGIIIAYCVCTIFAILIGSRLGATRAVA